MLVEQAQRLASTHTPRRSDSTPCVQFRCADMLSANVAAAGVVMLTSQCWDKSLIAATYSKLATELPAGALVVDYRAPPQGCLAAGGLVVRARVFAAVSWNPRQLFVVSERVEAR